MMDARKFDSLSRLIGSGSSRRHVLTTIAGGALASIPIASRSDDRATTRTNPPAIPGMSEEGKNVHDHMTAINGDANIEPMLQRVSAAGRRAASAKHPAIVKDDSAGVDSESGGQRSWHVP